MMIMPVFILVIFNQFAAGLSLYYLMYNILSAIQQKFINKQLEDESAKVEDESTAKGRKGAKPPKTGKNGQPKSSKRKRQRAKA